MNNGSYQTSHLVHLVKNSLQKNQIKCKKRLIICWFLVCQLFQTLQTGRQYIGIYKYIYWYTKIERINSKEFFFTFFVYKRYQLFVCIYRTYTFVKFHDNIDTHIVYKLCNAVFLPFWISNNSLIYWFTFEILNFK